MPRFSVEQQESGSFDVLKGRRPIAYDRDGYEVARVIEDECARDKVKPPRWVEVIFSDGTRQEIPPETLS